MWATLAVLHMTDHDPGGVYTRHIVHGWRSRGSTIACGRVRASVPGARRTRRQTSSGARSFAILACPPTGSALLVPTLVGKAERPRAPGRHRRARRRRQGRERRAHKGLDALLLKKPGTLVARSGCRRRREGGSHFSRCPTRLRRPPRHRRCRCSRYRRHRPRGPRWRRRRRRRCGSAEAIPRAESPSVPRRAGGEGVRVSVVGRGPLPIGSLRARAAAARLGGSGRPAGGCP